MDVQVGFREQFGVHAQPFGLAANVARGRVHALSHALAQKAGQCHAAFAAGHQGGLNKEDLAACRCPGQPRGHARRWLAHG